MNIEQAKKWISKDTAPICPYCGEVQSDCTNGGDAGHWYDARDGEVVTTDCGSCKGTFFVVVTWSPDFQGVDEDGNDWEESK